MLIIHVYRARTIFLLFCGDQDTEYDKWEIKTSTSNIIFTHENLSRAQWENYIHTLQKFRKYYWKYSYLWRF